jgi:hypothetical protein
VDKTRKVLYEDEEEGLSGCRPEVDRGQLPLFLLNVLTEGTVKGGHNLSKLDGKKVKLVFSEPEITATIDVAIGADGFGCLKLCSVFLSPFFGFL